MDWFSTDLLPERRAGGWFAPVVGAVSLVGSVFGPFAAWSNWRTDALMGLFWVSAAVAWWARGRTSLIRPLLGGAGVLVRLRN